jgi:hypothetical protein
MFKSGTGLAVALVLSAGYASEASATTLLFNFDGSFTASFELDSMPTPTSFTDFGFLGQSTFADVPIVFNGVDRTANLIFGTGLAAKLNIVGPGIPFTQLSGDTLFTGTTANPVFSPGVFRLQNPFLGQSLTVTITPAPTAGAIPEPATWAMLIAGFGLMGVAMRRRRSIGKAMRALS